MPGTFSDSWRLTKTAFGLIRQDRALLIFPLVAGLAILGVLGLLALGMFFVILPPLTSGTLTSGYEALAVVMFLIAYFAMTFFGVYGTAALIGAATMKLNGQQPTTADGWRIARQHLPALLAWAALTATVGLVIQAIQSRVRGIGGLVIAGVGGASWALLTYFIIPVLLYEHQGAWKSLARSGKLFISTFGRSLISNLVVGLIVGLGIFLAFVLLIVGWLLTATSLYVGIGVIVAALAVGAIMVLIGTAAEAILRAALYRFATTGKIDRDLLPAGYATAAVPPPPPPPGSTPLP
jgi:hypothetical protein